MILGGKLFWVLFIILLFIGTILAIAFGNFDALNILNKTP